MTGGWTREIKEIGLLSWAGPLAYLLTAAKTYIAGRSRSRLRPDIDGRSGRSHRSRHLWFNLTALLIGLGINKQLGLLTLLMDAVRRVAISDHLYSQRRGPQELAVVVIILGSTASIAALLARVRTLGLAASLATIGVLFLFTFVLVSSVSLHFIDSILGREVDGFRVSGLLELFALGMIVIGADWEALSSFTAKSRGDRSLSQGKRFFVWRQ